MLSRLRSQPSSARLFNGSSQYCLSTATPVTDEPMTLFCWGKTSNVSTQECAFSVCGAATTTSNWRIDSGTSGVLWARKITTNATAGTLQANVWHALCATFGSNTNRTAYLDGIAGTTNTGNVSDPAVTRVCVGQRGTSSAANYWEGSVAHAAIWNVALTAQEITALSVYRWCPLLIRPSSLVAYWPLCFGFDGDLAGGYHLTPTDSPTWTAGPQGIVYPRPTWQPAMAAEVAGGFQAAWAAGSNMLIGA